MPIAISRPDSDALSHDTVAAEAPPVDGMSLEDNERSLLVRALEKTNGNQTQAARLLRVTRDTLRYKMKKFNLR
jgi:DNA-binding protein Fis